MKNDKCLIHGGWVLLFRASCLAGVAPVQLENHRNGYSLSISQSYIIYSKILITLINFAAIIGIIIHCLFAGIRLDSKGSLFWVSYDIILCSVLALVGSYMSLRRMKNLTHCLALLQEVKSNIHLISEISTQPFNSKRKTIFILIIYCLIVIRSLVGNIILIMQHIHSSATFLFTVHQFVYIAKLFLELQIIYISLMVFVTIKLLNQKLEEMLSNTGFVQTKEIRKLRTLTQSYVSICDVALKTNKDDGVVMLLIVVNIIYSIILSGYIVYLNAISSQGLSAWFDSINVITCIFSAVKISIFIESYHRIFNQATYTRVILSKLIYHLTGVGQRISIDLEIMFKQLILNEPHYTPMGVFSLSRSNIITVFSIISTCAVYLVQMNVN